MHKNCWTSITKASEVIYAHADPRFRGKNRTIQIIMQLHDGSHCVWLTAKDAADFAQEIKMIAESTGQLAESPYAE